MILAVKSGSGWFEAKVRHFSLPEDFDLKAAKGRYEAYWMKDERWKQGPHGDPMTLSYWLWKHENLPLANAKSGLIVDSVGARP